MRRLPQDEALSERAWLEERDPGGFYCGYEVGAWPASTWVLNAMYENPHLPDRTHDENEKLAIAERRQEPTYINGVAIESETIATGGGLGYSRIPPQAWTRILWSDYSARIKRALALGTTTPPCYRWFPSGSWPMAIEPPTEGSLDERSFRSIIETLELEAPDPSGEYFAFWGEGPSQDDDARIVLYSGTLREIFDFVNDSDEVQPFSPSNIWPANRSWLTSTDWDLWGTQIGGTPELIAAIEANEHLETLRWERPPASE